MSKLVDSKIGECEVCDNTNVPLSLHYGNMWFCDDCWLKEENFKKTEVPIITEPINETNKLEQVSLEVSRTIDNSIQVRTDLFNAATVSIMELKKSIDENPEIANKPYVLAQELTNRYDHFKSIIFELNEKMVEAANNQKAIQIYLNQLANQLRSEEREKLRIQDINYKPTIKTTRVKSVSTSQTKKSTKLDKVMLRKYAAELGVAEFTLQMVAVSKGLTVEEAAKLLSKSINQAKSEVK